MKTSLSQDKISLLKNRVKTLQDICDEIDPFSEISEKHRETLSRIGPFDFTDPYGLTNQLIMMTENTLEEIHDLEK